MVGGEVDLVRLGERRHQRCTRPRMRSRRGSPVLGESETWRAGDRRGLRVYWIWLTQTVELMWFPPALQRQTLFPPICCGLLQSATTKVVAPEKNAQLVVLQEMPPASTLVGRSATAASVASPAATIAVRNREDVCTRKISSQCSLVGRAARQGNRRGGTCSWPERAMLAASHYGGIYSVARIGSTSWLFLDIGGRGGALRPGALGRAPGVCQRRRRGDRQQPGRAGPPSGGARAQELLVCRLRRRRRARRRRLQPDRHRRAQRAEPGSLPAPRHRAHRRAPGEPSRRTAALESPLGLSRFPSAPHKCPRTAFVDTCPDGPHGTLTSCPATGRYRTSGGACKWIVASAFGLGLAWVRARELGWRQLRFDAGSV